jgi:hypothetical protein
VPSRHQVAEREATRQRRGPRSFFPSAQALTLRSFVNAELEQDHRDVCNSRKFRLHRQQRVRRQLAPDLIGACDWTGPPPEPPTVLTVLAHEVSGRGETASYSTSDANAAFGGSPSAWMKSTRYRKTEKFALILSQEASDYWPWIGMNGGRYQAENCDPAG